MKLRFLPAVATLLSLLAPAARGTVLVYEGFHQDDYGITATASKTVNANAVTGTHTIGVQASKWTCNEGTTQILVVGSDYGLALPASLVNAGFSAHGGAISSNSGNNNSQLRSAYHGLVADTLKVSSGKLYFRMLVELDSPGAGKLISNSTFGGANGSYAGFGFCQSGSGRYLLTDSKSSLFFAFTKNANGTPILSLVVVDKDGTLSSYPLVADATPTSPSSAYICYAEVSVGAGSNGEERIRAGAMNVNDFTGTAQWAALSGASDSVDVDFMTDSSYPTVMAITTPYGTNNGYFRADEITVGTELGDILPADGMFLVSSSGTPTVGTNSFSIDWVLMADAGVTADAGLVWSTDATFATATTNSLGTGLAADTRTASLTGLDPDTTYWWKIFADNGSTVAETTPVSFTTLGAPVLGSTVATVTEQSAGFSVSLAEAAMQNTLPTSVSVFYGTDGETWTELPLGTASAATDLSGTAESLGYGVTYQWFARAAATMAGGRILSADSATNSFTTLWSGDMYVNAAAANATLPYTTPETAAKTLAAAMAVATDGATIHVAPGLYPITAPVAINKAIRVLGADPDPSRVIVSNKTNAGNGDGNHRVFTLNHADALVANLTMQNGMSWGSSGSSFLIESNGGAVSNCVVEAGLTKGNGGYSGGAYLKAGCVTHTVFRKCKIGSNSTSDKNQRNYPAVLALSGHSLAENCLFTDNTQDSSKALVLVRITDYSTIRNCSIVDSGLGSTNEYCTVFSALYINSSNATAQNVVVAGVTNLIDGAACRPAGTVSRFLNGAVDADISNVSAFPATTIVGTEAEFFPHHAENVPYAVKYRPKSGGILADKGVNYENMALYDLSGEQKRLIGSRIDIGCLEANTAGLVIIVK